MFYVIAEIENLGKKILCKIRTPSVVQETGHIKRSTPRSMSLSKGSYEPSFHVLKTPSVMFKGLSPVKVTEIANRR